jgi:hypothetical protein
MDPRQKLQLRTAAEKLLEWLDAAPDAKSCETCEHFARGGCAMANYAKPPAEVLAVGCELWEFNHVPF